MLKDGRMAQLRIFFESRSGQESDGDFFGGSIVKSADHTETYARSDVRLVQYRTGMASFLELVAQA